jgi:hypothetical protein
MKISKTNFLTISFYARNSYFFSRPLGTKLIALCFIVLEKKERAVCLFLL